MAEATPVKFDRSAVVWQRAVVAVLLCWGLTTTMAAPNPAAAQAHGPQPDPPSDAVPLIVVIRGSVGDAALYGAGFIFALGPDRLYIATAEHVLRDGPDPAENIEVQFWWSAGEWTPASIAETADRDLDLGVIILDTRSIHVPELDWRLLERPDALSRGDPVRPLGHPAGEVWHLPLAAHGVHEVTVRRIRTEGALVPGHSGGVLLTEDGGIVGMLTDRGSVLAESVRIDRVMERLEQWRYRPDLKFRDSPAGREIACHVSGRVVAEAGNRPLEGVELVLSSERDGRTQTLTPVLATTTPDGRFTFRCPDSVGRDDFPLTVELSHATWTTTQVSAVVVGYGDQRHDVEVAAREPAQSASTCVPEPRRPAPDDQLSQRRLQDGRIQSTWRFDWARCDGATRYHLYVKHRTALNPIIDSDTIRLNRYTHSSTHHGITASRDWTWRVRAFVDGRWGDWSDTRSFMVEPLTPPADGGPVIRDHRCPSPAPSAPQTTRPAPRPGYEWVPGYWQCRNREWVWIAGRWRRAGADGGSGAPAEYERLVAGAELAEELRAAAGQLARGEGAPHEEALERARSRLGK